MYMENIRHTERVHPDAVWGSCRAIIWEYQGLGAKWGEWRLKGRGEVAKGNRQDRMICFWFSVVICVFFML